MIDIVVIFLKSQVLFLPLIFFTLICIKKDFSVTFKWVFIKLSIMMFFIIPIILASLFLGNIHTMSNIEFSQTIDVPGGNFIVSNKSIISIYLNPFKIIGVISILFLFNLIINLILQWKREKELITKSLLVNTMDYPVYYSELVLSPFSSGILSKRIFLPMSYRDNSSINLIIFHEEYHLKDNHNLWAVIEEVLICINWYNPFFYIFKRYSSLIKEILADERALEKSSQTEYSRVVLKEYEKLKGQDFKYFATFFMKTSMISSRLESILKPQKDGVKKVLNIGGLGVLIISLFLTAVVGCSEKVKISDPGDESYINKAFYSDISNSFKKYKEDGKPAFNTLYSLNRGSLLKVYSLKDKLLFTYCNSDGEVINSVEFSDLEDVISWNIDFDEALNVLTYNSDTNTGKLYKYENSWILDQKIENLNISGINKIMIDKNRDLYIQGFKKFIIVKNGFPEEIGKIKNIRSVTVSPEGSVYFISFSDSNNIQVYYNNTGEVSSVATRYENIVVSYGDNSLYIVDAKGVKEYKELKFNGYIVRVDDYLELSNRFLLDIDYSLKKLFFTFIDDKGIGYSQLLVTDEKIKGNDLPVVRVMAPESSYRSLLLAARIYNKSQDNVAIEIEQFSTTGEDYFEQINKLNTDILTGNNTDIILLSDLPFKEYIKKNLLVDLSPYIERDLDLDMYYPAIDGASVKGRSYGICTQFDIVSLVLTGKKKVFSKYGIIDFTVNIGWNSLIDILIKEKKEVNKPLGLNYPDWVIEAYLGNITYQNGYFISGNSFNSELFREYLLSGRLLLDSDLVNQELKGQIDLYDKFIEEEISLFENRIGPMWTELIVKHNVFSGEDTVNIYPTLEDRGLAYTGNLFGIASNTRYIEEAWKFIKYLLNSEYQKSLKTWGIPVEKKALRDRTILSLEADDNFDFNLTDDTGQSKDYKGRSDYTTEDIEEYLDFFNKCNTFYYRDNTIGVVISDIAISYFKKEIDLDSAIRLAENKANTYLNE